MKIRPTGDNILIEPIKKKKKPNLEFYYQKIVKKNQSREK